MPSTFTVVGNEKERESGTGHRFLGIYWRQPTERRRARTLSPVKAVER
jgi:hypothetical protein